MAEVIDAFLAGSKPFALALFAPITDRVGVRPRIVADPGQLSALLKPGPALLVVEFEERWLPTLRSIRSERPEIRILAALARGQEGAGDTLRALGADLVGWEGQVTPVLSAVERLLAGAKPTAPVAARQVPPVTQPRPAAPGPAAARVVPATPASSPKNLFDDVEVEEGAPPAEQPVVQAVASGASHAAAPAWRPSAPHETGVRAKVAWPANVPGDDEAEAALVLAARGKLRPDAPLAAATTEALATMTELERRVLGADQTPFDARPIYRAAMMRLRMVSAVALAPPRGGEVDETAVNALLSEIDGLLSMVNAIMSAASTELRPQLEAVRNSLVKEAVDLSELYQAIGAPAPTVAPETTPAARAVSAARVLSVQAGRDEAEAGEGRRNSTLLWILAAVVLAAGAFHGYRWWSREQLIQSLATLPGAPDGMALMGGPSGKTKMLVPVAGAPSRVQIDRFKAQQAQQGNKVTEMPGGALMIVPEPPPAQPVSKGATP